MLQYVFHHWGAVEENQRWFDKLEAESDKLSEYLLSGPCSLTEYSTFYEYVKTLPNITYQEVVSDSCELLILYYFSSTRIHMYICIYNKLSTLLFRTL